MRLIDWLFKALRNGLFPEKSRVEIIESIEWDGKGNYCCFVLQALKGWNVEQLCDMTEEGWFRLKNWNKVNEAQDWTIRLMSSFFFLSQYSLDKSSICFTTQTLNKYSKNKSLSLDYQNSKLLEQISLSTSWLWFYSLSIFLWNFETNLWLVIKFLQEGHLSGTEHLPYP